MREGKSLSAVALGQERILLGNSGGPVLALLHGPNSFVRPRTKPPNHTTDFSFTPGFSLVLKRKTHRENRFNGLLSFEGNR